jgi:hypothetical protein
MMCLPYIARTSYLFRRTVRGGFGQAHAFSKLVLHQLMSNLTTLEAGAVCFLEKTRRLLIGWFKHVYPLVGFIITIRVLPSFP